jgi:hypothetical protein
VHHQVREHRGVPGLSGPDEHDQRPRRAGEMGFRVLQAAGVEGEADVPLAGLSLLLRALVSSASPIVLCPCRSGPGIW